MATVELQVGATTVDRHITVHCVACGSCECLDDATPAAPFANPQHWLCARCAPAHHWRVYRLLRLGARLPLQAARRIVQHLADKTAYLNARAGYSAEWLQLWSELAAPRAPRPYAALEGRGRHHPIN